MFALERKTQKHLDGLTLRWSFDYGRTRTHWPIRSDLKQHSLDVSTSRATTIALALNFGREISWTWCLDNVPDMNLPEKLWTF